MSIEDLKEQFKIAANTEEGKVYKYFPKNLNFFGNKNREIIQHAKHSFAFARCIGEAFEVCSPEFHRAYQEVTTGEGNEKDKINTIHSSSLLGLLCFYKISEDNKLKVTLKVDNEQFVNLVLNKIVFEETNPVFSHSVGLSSIDIALYGNDADTGENVALFLESKFSEYLHYGKSISNDQAKQYKPFYEFIEKEGGFYDDITYEYNDDKGKKVDKKKLIVSSDNHYCEGVKQMISHTIGAINSVKVENAKIYLGSILYDFWDNGTNDDTPLSDYKKVYSRLAIALQKLVNEFTDKVDYSRFFLTKYRNNPKLSEKQNKLFIIKDIISYQQFFDNCNIELDPSVKEYYCLQNNA